MIKKLVHNIARPHHPWRNVKFDELAEIYTSISLRSLGFSLIGIFVPLFLYNEGVTLENIFLFFGLFFLLRVPISPLTGRIVGKIGPKHTIALSTVVFIVFLFTLLSYSSMQWPLIVMALMFTSANSLFFLALDTDFSKIQHKKHGGKELGWLNIFERVGASAGPLIGGLIASFIAPEATIILAVVVLMLSLVPLFLTNEPIKTHQELTFKGFEQKKYARNNFATSVFNVVNMANGFLWPLLVGVYIFSDNAYAKLGFLVAIAMMISIFSARMFGRFVDNNKGRVLLNYGSVMSGFLNVSRSLITTGGGAFAVTTLGEPIVLSYRLPLMHGFYNEASSVEKDRIIYISWTHIWVSLTKAVYCFALYFATYFFDPVDVLRSQFIVIAILGLFMMTQKYPALKKV